MTLIEQITQFPSLGYSLTFSPGINGLSIQISKGEQKKESWLPYSDHCDEGTITRCIAFMIDKMHTEEIKSSPPGATEND